MGQQTVRLHGQGHSHLPPTPQLCPLLALPGECGEWHQTSLQPPAVSAARPVQPLPTPLSLPPYRRGRGRKTAQLRAGLKSPEGSMQETYFSTHNPPPAPPIHHSPTSAPPTPYTNLHLMSEPLAICKPPGLEGESHLHTAPTQRACSRLEQRIAPSGGAHGGEETQGLTQHLSHYCSGCNQPCSVECCEPLQTVLVVRCPGCEGRSGAPLTAHVPLLPPSGRDR